LAKKKGGKVRTEFKFSKGGRGERGSNTGTSEGADERTVL